MHPFKKMIFMLRTVNNVFTPSAFQIGGISSTSSAVPEDTCGSLTVDSICWFNTLTTDGVISTGDFVFNDVDGTSPIIGGSQYYKVSLAGISYITLITNTGEITVNNTCV
jgi:hypothetical protein